MLFLIPYFHAYTIELTDVALLDTEGRLGSALAVRARALLDTEAVDQPYRAALAVALEYPGNLLSTAPDLRWARFVWACCQAAGGQWEQAVRTATAVEIFMVALDMLDDLEDAETNAISASLGPARTLNASTGLLFLAYRELLSAAGDQATRLLLDGGLRACAGQHADLASAADHGSTLDGAPAIASAKSGTLVAAICCLGALIGGADEQRGQLFAQFGRYLGIVAQLANDIAALAPTALDKTDVALCRPTLPLAYAALPRTPMFKHADCRLTAWMDGPAQYTWAVADTYRRLALDLIPRLTADVAARAMLAALLHLL